LAGRKTQAASPDIYNFISNCVLSEVTSDSRSLAFYYK